MRRLKSKRFDLKSVQFKIGFFIFSWLFCPLLSFAGTPTSGDDLSDLLSSVKSDFGTSSTFIKLVYLAEIIVCVYGYHKTKNIGILSGIVVVSLFLNFALGHWVFTS